MEESSLKDFAQSDLNESDDNAQSTSASELSKVEKRISSPKLRRESGSSKAASLSDDDHTEVNVVDHEEVIGNAVEMDNILPSSRVNSTIVALSTESSFSCKFPGCNFTSTDVEAYFRHEDTHVNGGAFDCDICGTNFPSYANLRRHQLYNHQGIRTFECPFCSKRFLRKEQSYVEHLRTHSNPKPYQCVICGSNFSHIGQLKSHIEGEHLTSIADKSCNLCDFKASSPTAVKIHYASFHLKQNMEVSDENRAQDLVRRAPIAQTENGAIDLATVSQNFSLCAAHFPSYSNTALPGPSNLSRSSNIHHVSMSQTLEQNASFKNRKTSTIVKHPEVTYHTVNPPEQVCVKPEPPEAAVADGQNGNVLPTSTNDLSTSDIVGTTSNTTESEYHCRKKIHRHSISDDRTYESTSPSDRSNDGNTRHRCCRFRSTEEDGSQRCREYAHHICSHRHKRLRYSEDSDRSAQNEASDSEDRKVFATSTNSVSPNEVNHGHYSRVTHLTSHGTEAASDTNEGNFYANKNTIIIQDVRSVQKLICVYCGIIFPDQTLYLLHRSLHSESMPWKCNLCGKICKDKYDFNSHVISKGHF